MHFFYFDETGCDGKKLDNKEQPIFLMGGIIINDKKWNKTKEEFEKLIQPFRTQCANQGFEIHTSDLLTQDGGKHYKHISLDDRKEIVEKVLSYIKNKKIKILFFSINKNKIDKTEQSLKTYFDSMVPYLIAYDHLVFLVEKYMQKQGKTARALIILDEKKQFHSDVSKITEHRRFLIEKKHRIKLITEFSYPIDSKANPMIQLSDVVCFIIRKNLEIQHGFKKSYSDEIKGMYDNFFQIIKNNIEGKAFIKEELDLPYDEFLKKICVYPKKVSRKKNN